MAKDTHVERGLGRRKTAVARVQLVKEAATQQVNRKDLAEYFPTGAMQKAALAPLVETSQAETYGFRARVAGGGKMAQATALQLAIARALVAVDDGFKKQLRDGGYLTRDARMKERNKPGLKGARRAPQFSKR